MSATITINPQLAKAEDAAVNAARDVPTLIAGLKAADSPLAEQLQTKAAMGSTSMWGGVASYLVSLAVTKWSLGWDSTTSEMVSGLLAFAMVAVVRWLTDPRVTGFFVKTPARTTPATP